MIMVGANSVTDSGKITNGVNVTFNKSNSTSPGMLKVPGTMRPMGSFQDYISQGQTQWASGDITGYCQSFAVDLYWGNPSNSLALKIYEPNGCVLGWYYNGCDGYLDGNIPVTISESDGVPDGMYYFEVYGDQVTGSQWYQLSG